MPSPTGRFDAVIVGGGPAGALVALRLAQLGWRAILIERGPRHRNKTCGHCLNPRAIAVLRRYGLFNVIRTRAVGCTQSLRIHLPNGRQFASPLIDSRMSAVQSGLLVERSQFDQWLVDRAAAAGAEIVQPANAKMIEVSEGNSTVEVSANGRREQIKSRLIIGADGLGSLIARAAGFASGGHIGRKYGFSYDLHRRDEIAIDSQAISMFVVSGGYLGVVDQGNGVLHVAGLVENCRNDLERNPLAFCRRAAQHHSVLREIGLDRVDVNDLERFVAVGPIPWRPMEIANECVALVGDAAGYIEPFTGEGMTWAIESADVLTNVLAQMAPGEWNRHAAAQYTRAWKGRVGRRQLVCRVLTFALHRPRISALVMEAGHRFPAFARCLINQVVAA